MAKSSKTLEKFIQVMNEVYGACKPSDVHAWSPRGFERAASRYLWTDAFGVCNYLTLYKETGEDVYLSQAKALVSAVHQTLGKQRDGSSWLGSASEDQPTLGGLRIGKADPEGSYHGDHFKGDGQYYHYLTKWMLALNRMTAVTGDASYNRWGVELAQSVHDKFVYNRQLSRPRMYWKMKVDLSSPWVTSEGHDDPYDGYAMYRLLRDTDGGGVLEREIKDLEKIVETEYKRFDSADTLGLGCMLCITQYFPDEPWAAHITDVCKRRLEQLWARGSFPGGLAFREFGAYIGVRVHRDVWSEAWADRVRGLQEHWGARGRLYERDKDITPVMYCTTLIPGVVGAGYV